MIEYLFARARMQETEENARKATWLWWPSSPDSRRKVRSL